jgi:hypothetical protein
VPPEERFVCRFAAEPPQEQTPYGRWAERLQSEFLAACLRVQPEEGDEIGEAGELVYFPDRTWSGRTYVPVSTRSTTGMDLFGYVAFTPGDPESDEPEPSHFTAVADYTPETAESNPEWKLDICDEVIGGWRGEGTNVAAMTLVWGTALVKGGAIATAELADLAVDQCVLGNDRFTLVAPDAYRGDYLEISIWSARLQELARESLYEDE